MESEPAVTEAAGEHQPPRRLRNWYSVMVLWPMALAAGVGLARASARVGLPAGAGWTLGVAAGVAAFVMGYRRTGSGADERFNRMSKPMNVNAAQVLLLILAPFAIVAVAIGIVYVFHL